LVWGNPRKNKNSEDLEVKMLKRILLVALTVALLLSAGAAAVWLWDQVTSPAQAQTTGADSDYSPAQTITVVGQGSVTIEPDIARVSVGVETSAETVGEAIDENKELMDSILEALTELGIAEKDIQTTHFSVQLDRYPEPMPRAEPTTGEPQPQYRVSNMVNVTIRDLDQVSEVLDATIEAGANNLWGVSFALAKPEEAEADARANAIADAEARAEALAELSNVELGPVMSISEVVGGGGPMPVAVERAAVSGGGPISPGELEVGYQVQVTYFIEP
jgi:uncharacterized protein YggE